MEFVCLRGAEYPSAADFHSTFGEDGILISALLAHRVLRSDRIVAVAFSSISSNVIIYNLIL